MALTVKGLAKRYGPRLLFQEVTFGLGQGERAALIGPNGAGKTTLLKIIAGLEEAEAGTVEKPRTGSALGYLAQQVDYAPGRTVFEEALQASPRILALRQEKTALEEAMGTAASDAEIHTLAERYQQLLAQYEAQDGYAYEGRVARILRGMGFPEQVFGQEAASLSGGEASRLELCKLLVEEPALLLLDEPTNHLDIESVEWLEEYLQSYPGAILLVTHDRYFLERACTRILELDHGQVTAYSGGYARYLEQKAERLALQQKQYAQQQREIARLTRFITRWRADSIRSRQAKSREKALARMERVTIERPEVRELSLLFQQEQPSWTEVLTVEQISAQAGERVLFRDLSFQLERGDRLAIVGRNGAGKTTLLRRIVQAAQGGDAAIRWGNQTDVGYFAQAREEFDPEATVFGGVAAAHPQLRHEQVAALLGAVGFSPGEWERPLAQCSGGERSRAALAILLASRSNVLCLDEPTNHLDLLAREALEEALEAYPGTLIFISHDRTFMDRLAGKLLVLDGERTRLILGNYSHWVWQRSQAAGEVARMEQTAARKAPVRRPAAGGGGKKESRPRWTLEAIIEEVDRLERAIADVHMQLGDSELYKNHKNVQDVQGKLQELEDELALWMARLDELATTS